MVRVCRMNMVLFLFMFDHHLFLSVRQKCEMGQAFTQESVCMKEAIRKMVSELGISIQADSTFGLLLYCNCVARGSRYVTLMWLTKLVTRAKNISAIPL